MPDLQPWGNYAVLVFSVFGFGAMLCRLTMMSWWTHRPTVIGYHLSTAVACLWAGWRALDDRGELGDLMIALSALCWIGMSFPTWRHGPPQHTETRPAPLDELRHDG